MRRIIALLFVAVALFACAHVISKEVRRTALEDVPFRTVRLNIDNYMGKTFIWGGFIADTAVREDGTSIEIVQNPVGRYGGIRDTDVSEGRFIAYTKKELDPLIYEKGRLVTVAGELTGKREVKQDDRVTTYPVVRIVELHLWKEEPLYPPDYWYWERYPYLWNYPWGYWPYYYPPPRHRY